jgi:GNAT superfamily N-acetyltransferase
VSVAVRRAVAGDADAVADIFVSARAEMRYLPVLDVPSARAYISGCVTRLETWVAEEDAALLGFAMLEGDELDHLYVAPPAQGRGAGTALLDHVKSLRSDGFELWVFQRNEGARRFYERHGCVLVRETDGATNMEREPDALYAWQP